MPKHLRAMRVLPSTIEGTYRTVEVVWTTGAAVQRWDRLGEYTEVLDVTTEAVDLERLRAGAPVLNTHRSYDTSDVLGVVEDAWISFGKGYARLKFSDRAEVEPVWRDIEAGILRNLSVGYSIDDTKTEADAEGNRTVTVTKWTPHEISVVPIPADPESQFRSLDRPEVDEIAVEPDTADDQPETPPADVPETPEAEPATPEEIEDPALEAGAETETPETDEPEEEPAEALAAAPVEEAPAAPVPGERSVSAMIVRAAIEHGVPELAADLIDEGLDVEAAEVRLAGVSAIRSLCQRFKLDPAPFAGQSIDQVRAAILDQLAGADADVQARFVSDASVPDKPQAQRSALNAADIYARYRSALNAADIYARYRS